MAENAPHLDIQGMSVVALGSFNPAIFHPLWFAKTGLIRQEEAESAEVGIVHHDIASFSTEWFSLQVTVDQFKLETVDPSKFLPLRDLVIGAFGLLDHTPIRAFGLNVSRHYQMTSEDDWHRVGHHYVPKESWNDILEHPGTRTLVVEGNRPDSVAKYLRIKIEPSRRARNGVHLQINSHYEPIDSASQFRDLVASEWQGYSEYVERAAVHLFQRVGFDVERSQ